MNLPICINHVFQTQLRTSPLIIHPSIS